MNTRLVSKIFTAIVLLLLSSAALASVVPNPPGFTPPDSDLSVNFLGQVFGTVGNVVHGTGGQILGKMFDILNKGILVVAGLWISYTVMTVVIRSAQEGSFMGPNKNAAVILLRVAFGIALAVPSPSTGYSMLQDGLMRVVTAGVALADDTWNAALTYMANGGTLNVSPSKKNGLDADTTAAILYPADKVFTSAVCMLQSRQLAQQKRNEEEANNRNATNGFFVPVSAQPTNYDLYRDPTNNVIYFPGMGNTLPFNPNNEKATCGSIKGTGSFTTSDSTGKSQSWEAMNQLVVTLLPAAERYNCVLNPNGAGCGGSDANSINDQNATDMFSAILGYYNLIEPYARLKQGNASKQLDFIDVAKKDGWILAGRFYWDIASIDRKYEALSVINDMPSATGVDTDILKNNYPALFNLIENSRLPNDRKNYSDAISGPDGYVDKNSKLGIYLQELGTGTTTGSTQGPHLNVNKFVNDILKSIFPIILPDFNHIDYARPIQFLMKLGHDCLKTASYMWVEGITLISILGAVAGVCNSTNPLGVMFTNMVSWVKPVILGIAGALVVPGIILGYYLPLYPFIVFTFGAIGWLILVIESMVAAPLVAFGLTHPEGHDFLGRAEQALILILSVFLRPVLMVMGLIAGMLVSYVAFRFVVYGFTGILHSVFVQSGTGTGATSVLDAASRASVLTTGAGGGNVLAEFIVLPTLLVIFSMIVYTITQHCFSLIYSLPDNIMQWIGSQAKQDGTAQLVQRVESAASGAAKQSGDMMGQTLSSTGETLGRATTATGQWIRGKMKKDDSNNGEFGF